MPWAIGNYKGRAVRVPAAHGTAPRYRLGCRCDGCRAAYATLQRDRRARIKRNDCDWIVSTEFAREHLLELRAKQVGKRAIRDCTGISDTILMEIANGKRRRIRQSTEAKIMRVNEDGRAGGSRISAQRTTQLIDELKEAGYSITFLASKLGYATPNLAFYRRKNVTARNAMRVEKLYRLLLHENRVERMVRLATHSSARTAA